MILAGGLAPDNVATAIAAVRPYGVDVAGGVEREPGVKDWIKVAAFVQGREERRMSDLDAGHFGPFGGRFVAETLIPALDELDAAWRAAQADPAFVRELDDALVRVRRPPVAAHLRRPALARGRRRDKRARVYLKREDLNHTGAHKINNCVGQALLARRMGKRRLIAETGAGQHGVATATVAAKFGFAVRGLHGRRGRRAAEAQRLPHAPARRHRCTRSTSGTRTLKDAMNEALRDWVTNVHDTHYIIGSRRRAASVPDDGARPASRSSAARRARSSSSARGACPTPRSPASAAGRTRWACSTPSSATPGVQLHGVEAAGEGIASGRHAATLSEGRVGVLHGSKSFVLTDDDGQILPAHSISAGLDYPGVGPEHAWLKQTGRATYVSVTDDEALAGLQLLARTEGILCALETAHAIAYLPRLCDRRCPTSAVVVVALSGRGDKDMPTVARALGSRVVSERRAKPPQNRLVARMAALAAQRGEGARHLRDRGRSVAGGDAGAAGRDRARRRRRHRARRALVRSRRPTAW